MTAPAHDGLIAGRYQLVAPMGRGGTATVYRGLDILLDLEVAVKRLTPAPAADGTHAEAIERIFCEARAAAGIRHPGVAQVYDVVSGGDLPYLVMQLIKGRPLAELIAEQGPLPPHRVAGIGRQVLAALVAGHVVGVLHQDVQPGNVMITPDGQAVLTAFGTAATAGDPPVTRTGAVRGRPGYLAPERASGLPATPAADLWSLGATLYAALCGQGPFDGRGDALATLAAVAGEDPPHLAGAGSLYEVVNALLCRDPAGRPAFHEIARALDAAAANAPAEEAPAQETPAEEAPPPVPPSFGREPDPQPEAAAAPVPAFVPPSPGAHARHAEVGAARADRRGRASLILTAVAGLGLVATAVAVFGPGTSRSAPPPAPARSSPAPARSSPGLAPSPPGLAGPAAPPPVGQQFRVAAAANPDGSPEVVARARNGTLIAARATSGSWSAWTALPGGPAYTGVPAVVTAKDGRLIVFARAVTGQVAELWQASPGSASWQGPVPLGPAITHSSPAAVTWPDGHLEVFALLSDAHVGYVSQSSTSGGGTWTGWSSLGGPVTGPPAVALDATGHPQVFAATAGRLLTHDYYLDGHWAGWVPAPGNARYVGVPGIAADADGRLEVFARSTNGDLLHVWQLPGAGMRWGGPGRLAENGCSTDPAVFSGIHGVHGGHLEAFCMDSTFGFSVFHTVQLSPKPGTPWSPWQSLKGSSDGAVTALQTRTVTEILARTASGTLAYATWTAQHGWSGWSMLPNSS
jgi:eukaryotic-like serine/threonine-protein kinase